MKQYQKLEYRLGGNVEGAVNELLTCKEKNILASIEFNGHMLYSDTVTMDDAYLKIVGETKEAHDAKLLKYKEDAEQREKEHQESIPQLTEHWIKVGHEVLLEKDWELWDKIVPIRLSDLYKGFELKCLIDLAKVLNYDGTFEDAKIVIDEQGHSGMSFGLICGMVREFCIKGEEFVEFVI